jgi:peptidoglycan/xylan/chitin deacetylase (PgdA/CDA1 family)
MIGRLNPVESVLLRAGARLASGSQRSAALLVLIYHRVLHAPDPLLPEEPDAAGFAQQLDLLGDHFTVLPLREAVARLARHSLPPRSVCITFDDGYANNCDVAAPLLSARGMPATVFVAPGFLSGGRMFNDTIIEALRRAPEQFDLGDIGLGQHVLSDDAARRRAIASIIPALKHLPPGLRSERATALAERAGGVLPTDLMMSDAQVLQLHHGGIEIGAHTLNHPILASVDEDTARHEIVASKARLEDIIGAPVTSFAYPNGRPGRDYGPRDVALARAAGFELALSTAWGAATAGRDVFQIPRVAPWDRTAPRFGLRLVRAYRERNAAVA